MGHSVGRIPAETRALLLQAASVLFLERGLSASLDDVARRAGVSKGGLKYYFNTKDELITALAEHQVQLFRSEVHSQLEDGDNGPGRLVRAYIRANVNPGVDASISRERHTLLVLLGTVPSVQEIWRLDSLWWQEAMDADALDQELRDIVLAAADGAAAAAVWGSVHTSPRTTRLRDHLLQMTRGTTAL